jgi:hypothetical protein
MLGIQFSKSNMPSKEYFSIEGCYNIVIKAKALCKSSKTVVEIRNDVWDSTAHECEVIQRMSEAFRTIFYPLVGRDDIEERICKE